MGEVDRSDHRAGGTVPAMLRRWRALLVLLLVLVTACRVPFDYDAERGGDLVWSVHDPVDGVRRWFQGDDPTPFAELPVDAGAIPVDADWDGDGRWDPAVVDAAGTWRSVTALPPTSFPAPTGCSWAGDWGGEPAIPVVGDFDGDGSTDPGWYCSVDATWHLDGEPPVAFGAPPDPAHVVWHDVPAPADYDGDGVTDLAVYRPVDGSWWVQGAAAPIATGLPLGLPVPASYVAGGGVEAAVFSLTDGTFTIAGVGSTDGPGAELLRAAYESTSSLARYAHPAPVDVDGDGVVELAVLVELSGEDPAARYVVDDGTDLVLDVGDLWPRPSATGPFGMVETNRVLGLERACLPDSGHPCLRSLGP